MDSQQTKLMRRLAPHFEHRLFLSATPHNGYPESFTALLEIIDDQRFVRGVEPDPAALGHGLRRLKSRSPTPTGTPGSRRDARRSPSAYPDNEREAQPCSGVRRAAPPAAHTGRGRASVDLVTLLLKKRLFSSPRAFAHTVGVHLETARPAGSQPPRRQDEVPEWMEGFLDDEPAYDDEELAEAEDDATARRAESRPS